MLPRLTSFIHNNIYLCVVTANDRVLVVAERYEKKINQTNKAEKSRRHLSRQSNCIVSEKRNKYSLRYCTLYVCLFIQHRVNLLKVAFVLYMSRYCFCSTVVNSSYRLCSCVFVFVCYTNFVVSSFT